MICQLYKSRYLLGCTWMRPLWIWLDISHPLVRKGLWVDLHCGLSLDCCLNFFQEKRLFHWSFLWLSLYTGSSGWCFTQMWYSHIKLISTFFKKERVYTSLSRLFKWSVSSSCHIVIHAWYQKIASAAEIIAKRDQMFTVISRLKARLMHGL